MPDINQKSLRLRLHRVTFVTALLFLATSSIAQTGQETITKNDIASAAIQSGADVFYQAVAEGDLQFVRDFIDQHSCQSGAEDECSFLNKAYAGNIPLHMAARNGNLVMFETLVEAGAHLHLLEPKSGPSVLHAAVLGGNIKIVQHLLTSGVNHNTRDEWQKTPIEYAATKCTILNELLQSGAQLPFGASERAEMLDNAIIYKHNRCLETLLDAGISPNYQTQNIYQEDTLGLGIVRQDIGFEVRLTHLDHAVFSDNLDGFRILLKGGASANSHIARSLFISDITRDRTQGYRHYYAETLLDAGLVPDFVEPNGNHVLHWIVESGNLSLLNKAIEAGVNPDATGKIPISPLSNAIRRNRPDMARALLRAGASPNFDPSGANVTPIHYAVSNGLPGTVRDLIEFGADIDPKTISGFTPLHSVLTTMIQLDQAEKIKTHERILSILLDSGANALLKDNDGLSPLSASIVFSSKHIPQSTYKPLSPGTSVRLFENLDDNEKQAQVENLELLSDAIISDDQKFIDHILLAMGQAGGFREHPRSDHPLALSLGSKNFELFERLITLDESSPFPKHLWENMIISASVHGRTDALEFLSRIDDIRVVDDEGKNALHAASSHGQQRTIEYLLSKGFEPTQKDAQERTALNRAAEGGHLGSLRVLLDAVSGDLPEPNTHGWTLLHSAAQGGDIKIISSVADHDVDINAQEAMKGRTALMLAAELDSNVEAVGNLISLGADANIRDYFGRTALEYASSEEVKAILAKVTETD